MNTPLILGFLLLFAFQPSAEAHRLNEYLQATTISLYRDSVRLHMHLVPGSDIAFNVLMDIDLNHNGLISKTEELVYGQLVLHRLSLNIDGKQAPLQLRYWSFPSVEELRKGTGDIQLYLAAALVPSKVTHQLVFENHQQQANSVYLVNCLLPDNSHISVTGQSRNYNQSRYTLDFTILNTIQASVANQKGLLDGADKGDVCKTYFFRGVLHILTGYDHLLFLCVLILGAAGLLDLIKIVTAFTIAHSITLTLATLGLVHLPEYIVEPLIAASIVCVALQNIFWTKYAGGIGRLTIAFFFGLFHGLGFANGLLQLIDATLLHTVFYSILGFSLGVEAGNQMVLLPLYGILQSVKRFKTEVVMSKRLITLPQLASSIVGVAGLYHLCIALKTHL